MSNKDINIIFFGNTDFSNPTLLACNKRFNLKAVVTNKSKKMGCSESRATKKIGF